MTLGMPFLTLGTPYNVFGMPAMYMGYPLLDIPHMVYQMPIDMTTIYDGHRNITVEDVQVRN